MTGASAQSQATVPTFVSIVVCTRDRAATLIDCLAAIDRAVVAFSRQRVEIVVVDNGSTDATQKVIERFVVASQSRVVAINEPRKGLSIARNAGVKAACGAVLAFVDDDCVMPETYLLELETRYAQGPTDVVRGGRVELGSCLDLPLTIKTSLQNERYAAPSNPGGFILGCNFTMPSHVARRLGSFDERFGVGGRYRSAEDTDYVLRAHLANVPVEFAASMTLAHHHGRREAIDRRKLIAAYQIGNGALYMKHFKTCPWLAKRVLWTARNAVRETFGGPKFDEAGTSHWEIVCGNVRGASLYLFDQLACCVSAVVARLASRRQKREDVGLEENRQGRSGRRLRRPAGNRSHADRDSS